MKNRGRLILKILVVIIVMLVWMTGYELSKELVFPHITLWESHLITVLFSTFLATIAAFLIFRKYQILVDQLSVELEERQRAEAALQKAHDELEERVQERTAELLRVNEELRGEIRDRYQGKRPGGPVRAGTGNWWKMPTVSS